MGEPEQVRPRWTIVPTSCDCGGRWAWMLTLPGRAGRMQGCVCHHPWTLALRVDTPPTRYHCTECRRLILQGYAEITIAARSREEAELSLFRHVAASFNEHPVDVGPALPGADLDFDPACGYWRTMLRIAPAAQ